MGVNRQKGYLCIVLHAHLPYVRHPEHAYFLEENWLFEAMTESYIPLLDVFSRMINDRIGFRVTLSLSPSLMEMLNDSLLMQRYTAHLARLIELTRRERRRVRGDHRFEPVVRMYQGRFKKIRYLFEEVYRKNLIPVFRQMQETGHLEIIPSAATHAYLPHLALYPGAVRAQIKTGLQLYRKNFGRYPNGIWFPECGFNHGFDRYIRDDGITFFFLEAHGIIRGKPLPQYGTYLPVLCDSGALAFGRDVAASRQVWSSLGGYPGDPNYRDFYRDAGFDIDEDQIRDFTEPYGAKTYTGLKYYRITGGTDNKKPYSVQAARIKVKEHANHFITVRETQIRKLFDKLRVCPVITATYDAELFGHWWFEGVDWLEMCLRSMDTRSVEIHTITPSEYLSLHDGMPRVQISYPSASSWGEKGYHEVWLNDRNDYLYRHILKAAERMIALADQFPNAEGILRRALNQAAREVLLSQHSDWAFMMKNGLSDGYARTRFETHISRFTCLYESILSGIVCEVTLREMEDRDRIFQDMDYRIFRSGQEKPDSHRMNMSVQ
jgi:1,4-alpha-glucan branching enzyme